MIEVIDASNILQKEVITLPPLSVLIKPASSSCNLKCSYCFYHSISGHREIENYGVMDIEILEVIVKKALAFADHICTFAFQGGEPTLAGLEFYEKLLEFQKKYNTKRVTINNAIQTNGVNIDDFWSRFLAHNHFLVGLSLDGPKEIHDSNRLDHSDKGSFSRVMAAASLFSKYGVEYNILCVINAHAARHPSKVYNFFKKSNFKYLQFIPCLDPLGDAPGENGYSLSPDRYSYFLKNMFDLWYDDVIRGNMISIRYFDNLVGMLMGYPPEACGMTGQCQCQFVIEANGGVYPCDFYVLDEWYMGNIKEMDFSELVSSTAATAFIDSSRPVDAKCRGCKWFNLCRGGCRRSREPFSDNMPALNYYCSSYREFFQYAGDRLLSLARQLSRRR